MRLAGGLAALPSALLGSPAEPVVEQQLLMPTAIGDPMFAGDLSHVDVLQNICGCLIHPSLLCLQSRQHRALDESR